GEADSPAAHRVARCALRPTRPCRSRGHRGCCAGAAPARRFGVTTTRQRESLPAEATGPTHLPMFSALHVRNFRLYLSGQAVSNTGTWMQRIAQDWLVLQLTDSQLAVGVTTALQFLPVLLFS